MAHIQSWKLVGDHFLVVKPDYSRKFLRYEVFKEFSYIIGEYELDDIIDLNRLYTNYVGDHIEEFQLVIEILRKTGFVETNRDGIKLTDTGLIQWVDDIKEDTKDGFEVGIH